MDKTCDKCHETKKRVYFYLDHNSPDKRSNTCMACVNANKRLAKKKRHKKVKEDPRRKPQSQELVLYNRKSQTKIAQILYEAETTPTFMQFNHMIYKHVSDKYGLTFSQLNLLLFMFPICPFPRRDFLTAREIMGYKEIGLMKMFIDKGYIYVWKKALKNDRIPTLYDLTEKGKKLIQDVHEWALGKKKIPEINENKAVDLMTKLYLRKRS